MKKDCKDSYSKGFFSQKGKPTQNAVMMFFVYLTFTPKDWVHGQGKLYEPALQMVRNHFGKQCGCKCMLTWGTQYGCRKSKTSDGRYHAMSLAFHDAKGMIGQGYIYTTKKP